MTENVVPAASGSVGDSVDRVKEKADYDGLRQTVRRLLARKHELQRNMVCHACS